LRAPSSLKTQEKQVPQNLQTTFGAIEKIQSVEPICLDGALKTHLPNFTLILLDNCRTESEISFSISCCHSGESIHPVSSSPLMIIRQGDFPLFLSERHSGDLQLKFSSKRLVCELTKVGSHSSKSRIISCISGIAWIAWISCQVMVAMKRELPLRPSAVREKKLAPSPSHSSAMVYTMADFPTPAGPKNEAFYASGIRPRPAPLPMP